MENLRFNLRKTEEGMGGSTKPEDLLEENRGGMGGSRPVFLLRKRKELEVLSYGPLFEGYSFIKD